MRFEKGKKSLSRGGFELVYATETDVEAVSFCSVDYPNHTLVGGVSVNRHSIIVMHILGYCIKKRMHSTTLLPNKFLNAH